MSSCDNNASRSLVQVFVRQHEVALSALFLLTGHFTEKRAEPVSRQRGLLLMCFKSHYTPKPLDAVTIFSVHGNRNAPVKEGKEYWVTFKR